MSFQTSVQFILSKTEPWRYSRQRLRIESVKTDSRVLGTPRSIAVLWVGLINSDFSFVAAACLEFELSVLTIYGERFTA